jgi:hypothetical protein
MSRGILVRQGWMDAVGAPACGTKLLRDHQRGVAQDGSRVPGRLLATLQPTDAGPPWIREPGCLYHTGDTPI